jgi:hypothetical protein
MWFRSGKSRDRPSELFVLRCFSHDPGSGLAEILISFAPCSGALHHIPDAVKFLMDTFTLPFTPLCLFMLRSVWSSRLCDFWFAGLFLAHVDSFPRGETRAPALWISNRTTTSSRNSLTSPAKIDS